MKVFADSQILYGCLETLFEQLRLNEKAMRPLTKSKLVICLRFTNPDGMIVVNAGKKPVEVKYGEKGKKATLDVKMPAITFHKILLDQLSLTKALGQNKIEMKGPIIKLMAMTELFKQGRKLYPKILRQQGIRPY